MTQQVINIGAALEDGTGDPLRTSFDKCNQNFAELYSAPYEYVTYSGLEEEPIEGKIAQFVTGGVSEEYTIKGVNISDVMVEYQLADGDLTALAALTGTNTIYYRSGTDTWSPVTIGAGLNFATGTLTGTGAPLASPTFTGDPKAPTPTAGDNDTSVATTAFVTTAIAGKADSSALTAKADLASPTFTGDPKAPTPTAGDNDTSVATTAFVTTAISTGISSLAALASPTFTGDPKAPTPTAGDNDTSIATTAFVTAAVAAVGGGAVSPPQGRLTLQTGVPVMTTTQSAKTTIYYTPYCGALCPLYGGSSFAMTTFTELSVATTDTTKSPAAIGASKVNDWFVWNDAGTVRIGHGPDWTSDTVRSAGTALTMVNGILLNNASITNGPAAQRGTYVGTTRSNASSQLDWIYGAVAATPVAGVFGVWNMYNRIYVSSLAGDLTDNWTYALAAVRAANAKATARHSFVSGMAEDAFEGLYTCHGVGTPLVIVGVCYDVTNAFSGVTGFASNTGSVSLIGTHITTALGFHFFQAGESAGGAASATFVGDNADATLYKTGIVFKGWM